jgi:hypothetical protein
VFWLNKRWFRPSLLPVPTEKVGPAPPCCPITTEVTERKAKLPVTVPPVALAKRKASLIGLPSTLVPFTVTNESIIWAVVPPPVTVRFLGTSGSVIPLVAVTIVVAPLVAAKTAVVEAVATFLPFVVYPNEPE